MRSTPKGLRLHIGIFGRRNAGKSSLLNALTRQNVSIVSDVAGTTTDPVEKPMELLAIGAALSIDTAGSGDAGAPGRLRVERTRQIFDRANVGMFVAETAEWGPFEEGVLSQLSSWKIPSIVALNKADLAPPPATLPLTSRRLPFRSCSHATRATWTNSCEGRVR